MRDVGDGQEDVVERRGVRLGLESVGGEAAWHGCGWCWWWMWVGE